MTLCFYLMHLLPRYAKIVAHTSYGLDYPTSFEPALCDLLDRLLCPDPKKRLGCIKGDVAMIK